MFTHLHVHSNYSFCRGGSTIENLVDSALVKGMPSMALTDLNGVYGLIWFLQYAAERGLRPIVGSELRTETERAILLVRNRSGYGTLCRIISRRQSEPDFCLSNALAEERENLVVISDQIPLLHKLAASSGTAGIYVELNDPGSERPLLDFCRSSGIPPVATNDVYFVDPSDFALHRLLRAIDLNTCFSRIPPGELAGEDRWLKPEEAMARRYPHCSQRRWTTRRVSPQIAQPIWGSASLCSRPSSSRTGRMLSSILQEECYRGAERRYGELSDSVLKRLRHELEIIKDKGLCDLFPDRARHRPAIRTNLRPRVRGREPRGLLPRDHACRADHASISFSNVF